jgi:hypothetical protein
MTIVSMTSGFFWIDILLFTMPKHVFYDLSYSTTMGESTKKWHKRFKKQL